MKKVSESLEQLTLFESAPDTCCGKTSPEYFPPTTAKTSAPSWRKLLELKTVPVQCLDLTPGYGNLLGQSFWEMNSAWLGVSWTLNSGVSPNEEKESSLLQILEDHPHRKYYLSKTACLGILRRAKTRDKELPPQLKDALMIQAGIQTVANVVMPEEKNKKLFAFHINQREETINLGHVSGALMATRNMQMQTFVSKAVPQCFATDVINKGGSNTTGTLRAQEHGHQPLVIPSKQMLFENHGIDSRYTGPHEVSPTMSARMGTGGNNVPLVGTPIAFSLDSQASNSMKSANPHSGCRKTVTARTIDTTNPDPSKNQGGIAILQEAICIAGNTIDRTPKNGGNGLGCQPDISYTLTGADRHAVCEPYQDVIGALCRGDGKGISNQYVGQDKCIVEPRNLIRRLTPLECERLQGFPDGWTQLDNASDSARYKALGNSVAIPCVSFIMHGIALFLNEEGSLNNAG